MPVRLAQPAAHRLPAAQGRLARRGVATLTAAATALTLLVVGASPAAARGGEVGGTGAHYSFEDSPGGGATSFRYGRAWDRTLLGDWNGDGVDTLAVRRGNLYYFTNTFGPGNADTVIAYGRPDDTVLVGDWDGDGVDTLAVRRGNEYHIKNDLSSGVADIVLTYGRNMDIAVVGDWDGDGVDTLGLRRQWTFYLANSFAGGLADREIRVGGSADIPFAGDWDGDGRDDVGVRDCTNAEMITRTMRGREERFSFGEVQDRLLVGDWNGDGVDSFGVRGGEAWELANRPASVTKGEIVLAAAREKIGGPYVWGANGPTEYDCSGLTRFAYGQAGKWLPRLSGDQPSRGTLITPAEAQPGDLIWWPGHVAIYAGNGMMVDAANEGLGILERPVPSNPTFYRMF